MKKELDLRSKNPSCLYIDSIEYARRKSGAAGLSRASIETSLKLEILAPMKPSTLENGLYPLVVFVVGGGFHTPRVLARIPWMARLAERGFVVAMPAYRGTEDNRFPDMMEDIHSAIRFLRSHADVYGIDPDRVVLMGGSAGGHIALQTGYAPNDFTAPTDDVTVSAAVSGVIDLYGTSDISKMIRKDVSLTQLVTSPPAQLTKCFEVNKLEEALAPTCILQYVTPEAEIPPTLIAHGDADQLVAIEQSECLYQALVDAGKDVEYYCVKNAGHAAPIFFETEMMDIYEAFIRRVTNS